MNENPLDFQQQTGYNKGNDDYEIFDLTGVPPLNDLECTHQTLVSDPEDTIGKAIYHGCSNPKCGRGWYIQPMK